MPVPTEAHENFLRAARGKIRSPTRVSWGHTVDRVGVSQSRGVCPEDTHVSLLTSLISRDLGNICTCSNRSTQHDLIATTCDEPAQLICRR